MHDPAADYCQEGGGGRSRLVKDGGGKNSEIGCFSDFQRTDLGFPAEGTRAFYCKGAQRGVAVEARRFRLRPEIEIADAHDGVRAETDRDAGVLELS